MERYGYISLYMDAICRNAVTVGKWVRLAYKMVIDLLDKKECFFSKKKADKAIGFIENFCRHSEGRNDLLKLELWQKACVSVIFGVLDSDGYRTFREIFIIIARKNGKTLFAAAIITYMAYCDGEHGAKIYCLAPKLEQADLVYDAFYQIVQSDEELGNPDFTKKRRSDIYIKDFNTSIKRLAFNSKKSDGFNPHLTVCDEIEAWNGDSGKKQYEVMKSALGARKQPLILSIGTAGYVNDGIYDELQTRSFKLLNGVSDEKRLFPLMYIIDDIEKWDDLNELKKSNPNLGVSVFPDFYEEEIKIARLNSSKKSEFMCKYCNIKQNSSMAWLNFEDVVPVFNDEIDLKDFSGAYALFGIDLSQTTDITAVAVLIEKIGKLYAFVQFFMPADGVERLQEAENVPYKEYVKKGYVKVAGEHYVDYKAVEEYIVSLLKQYKIKPVVIGYDRYSSQYLVEDLKSFGFKCDDVFQGTNLSGVVDELEGLLKEKKIECGTNMLLKMHFLNVALKYNENGDGRKKPVKLAPALHIDGFMATMDALTVRSKYYSQYGKMLSNTKLWKNAE